MNTASKGLSLSELRSFEWVLYDKVGVLYSEKLGNRSEARASDLKRPAGDTRCVSAQ